MSQMEKTIGSNGEKAAAPQAGTVAGALASLLGVDWMFISVPALGASMLNALF